jgi:hypothetical protein
MQGVDVSTICSAEAIHRLGERCAPVRVALGRGGGVANPRHGTRNGCGLRLARAPDDDPPGRAQLPDLG